MFLLGDDRRLVLSASDLRTAAGCEFALVRELDVVLGRAPAVAVDADPMAARVIELGNEHEQAELRRLARAHPGRVVQFQRPGYSPEDLRRAHAETLDALSSDAEVVFQATFFDGGFVGFADFLVRSRRRLAGQRHQARPHARASPRCSSSPPTPSSSSARACRCADTVARSSLGERRRARTASTTSLPVYRAAPRTARAARSTSASPTRRRSRWGDPRYARVRAVRDVRPRGRGAPRRAARRRHRGPRSARGCIDGRASRRSTSSPARTEPVAGIGATHARPDCACRRGCSSRQERERASRLVPALRGRRRRDALARGDPRARRRATSSSTSRATRCTPRARPTDWGLEYLFGMVEVDARAAFAPLWAHTAPRSGRRSSDFLALVAERRAAHPRHAHLPLRRLRAPAPARAGRAARRGEDDGRPAAARRRASSTCTRSCARGPRVGSRSYSIKKLEPLYMGAELREAT